MYTGIMPQSTRLSAGAMFDVKPVDETGDVDVQKIAAVRSTINLSSFRPKKPRPVKKQAPIEQEIKAQPRPIIQAAPPVAPEEVLPLSLELPTQAHIKQQ